MATLTEIKNKANTKLTEFWDALAIKQEAYFQKHGKYFQLLVTSPVVDGVDTTFEVIHPGDEKHLADVDFTFNSPIPFQILVTEWVGPDRGFLATATVELLDGRKFTRSRKLTDTRVSRVKDYTADGTPKDSHWVGDTPTIETTAWTEVIEPTI